MHHLLTHTPYNKYCEACVMGKMTHARHPRVTFDKRTVFKKFGDTITCDHIDSTNWPSNQGHN